MSNIPDIRGKRVTVLGAARSGIAVAKLLKTHGAHVFLSEMASEEERREQARIVHSDGIPAEFGGHSDRIMDADWWVVSPGISISSLVIKRAEESGIPVWGELEVASWFCKSPIIAITGSNGKSSVTTLLGEVFKAVGKQCIVAGNIGRPFSDHVDNSVPEGVVVLEVSSFQLETIETFHPYIAVLLNLTPDHLDRHGSMENYGRIKLRLIENQIESDFVIYNGNDQHICCLVKNARSQKVAFNTTETADGYLKNGMLTLRGNDRDETILPAREMGVQGEHNLANGLAVALAARIMHVGIEQTGRVFRDFHGLPHRLEFVREIHGVRWVNDSKATNTFSVWYALGSFSRPIILIAGGRDKDADFRKLLKRIKEKTRALILLGEAAEKMAAVFQDVVPVIMLFSLEEAVVHASQMAESGDVVLLSPGCSSFDMFRDFEDRGDQFKNIVRAL